MLEREDEHEDAHLRALTKSQDTAPHSLAQTGSKSKTSSTSRSHKAAGILGGPDDQSSDDNFAERRRQGEKKDVDYKAQTQKYAYDNTADERRNVRNNNNADFRDQRLSLLGFDVSWDAEKRLQLMMLMCFGGMCALVVCAFGMGKGKSRSTGSGGPLETITQSKNEEADPLAQPEQS